MNQRSLLKPDYLFEVSWEICNKVGGIYTVVSTKVPTLKKEFGDHLILLGPDVWKETGEHPEFAEDLNLFRAWRESAQTDGLNIRVGRWRIPGDPIVILVDFTPFFSHKNEIFAELWEKFQLDSLTGQWDYVEPALFGYAAAIVIESFYDYYLSARDRIVAQFHEWMTGAGVLYLKEHVPQTATVFTTHATILGRSVAGNGQRLYEQMDLLDPESLAQTYNIVAKFSLEKIAALESDCFTTVSEITARECLAFIRRKPDVITQNGFDGRFVPPAGEFPARHDAARSAVLSVAGNMLGYPADPGALLVLHSGRYEFRNKGIDLFIDALAELNRTCERQVLACIAVPGNHAGPNRELRNRMAKFAGSGDQPLILTHHLHDEGNDPVIRRLHEKGLLNRPEDTVKVIFAPAYLDGRDGIFNLGYYDFLAGFDLTVFPSYYEPWGYTPLESAAFGIPTLTTSLAGFGLWIRAKDPQEQMAIRVIDRDDNHDQDIVAAIRAFIRDHAFSDEKQRKVFTEKSHSLSQTALWPELIEKYQMAYAHALKQSSGRASLYKDKRQREPYFLKDIASEQKPTWNKIFVEPAIPPKLEKLQKLSRNLWWVWNFRAEELFASIDQDLWRTSDHNPIAMLEALSMDELRALEKKKGFIDQLDAVYEDFERYMEARSGRPDSRIAYFSMEFGLHDTLKIYSGGLGILAGDYLKEASDSNMHMVGVGLLYRYGYFRQTLSFKGDQIADLIPQKFTHLPLNPVRNQKGEWVVVSIALPGRNLYAKAWEVSVGRIPLYLLDTDIPENQPQDRSVTHQLYGGDPENRFKQEMLLGVGGIRLLREINYRADVYHCNEGHAAFIGFERIRTLMQERALTFNQAVEVVRASTLFTTHTPVPAGHDAFEEDLLRTYLPHYASRMGISWQEFMGLGRINRDDHSEKFSMSILAVKLSQEVNGVSKIHGRVSREMFQPLYDGYFPEELHIGHVTNGVHMPTWAGVEWQKLYQSHFGQRFWNEQSDPLHWEKIREVEDKEIWRIRNQYRKELVTYLRERIMSDFTRKQENPNLGFRITDRLNERALTIGFARRFATYKRAHLLFTNLERLAAIVGNPEKPVQIIFAGKAHPADKAGQDLIRTIVEISRRPEFLGKIFFVENYEIELAKKLIPGVDIWLNTPTRPLEASGTSGEKAVMNGTVNLSVLDGWWAEGYRPGAGWGLQEKRTYANQGYQDELDAELIYDIIEEQVIPEFFDLQNGVPERWISHIKNTIAWIAPNFTMKRMLDDYRRNYYDKLVARSRAMKENNCQLAKDVDQWKSKVLEAWSGVGVKRLSVPDSTRRPLVLGDDFIAEIEISLNGLRPDDLGIDVLFGQKDGDVVKKLLFREEMTMVRTNHERVLFTCRLPMERVGVYDYAFRLYPKNPALPHRQDFGLVRWI